MAMDKKNREVRVIFGCWGKTKELKRELQLKRFVVLMTTKLYQENYTIDYYNIQSRTDIRTQRSSLSL